MTFEKILFLYASHLKRFLFHVCHICKDSCSTCITFEKIPFHMHHICKDSCTTCIRFYKILFNMYHIGKYSFPRALHWKRFFFSFSHESHLIFSFSTCITFEKNLFQTITFEKIIFPHVSQLKRSFSTCITFESYVPLLNLVSF